jgi:hypothetical protein
VLAIYLIRQQFSLMEARSPENSFGAILREKRLFELFHYQFLLFFRNILEFAPRLRSGQAGEFPDAADEN